MPVTMLIYNEAWQHVNRTKLSLVTAPARMLIWNKMHWDRLIWPIMFAVVYYLLKYACVTGHPCMFISPSLQGSSFCIDESKISVQNVFLNQEQNASSSPRGQEVAHSLLWMTYVALSYG